MVDAILNKGESFSLSFRVFLRCKLHTIETIGKFISFMKISLRAELNSVGSIDYMFIGVAVSSTSLVADSNEFICAKGGSLVSTCFIIGIVSTCSTVGTSTEFRLIC